MQKSSLCGYSEKTAKPSSILERKEVVRLQDREDYIHMVGCKCACGSVWCRDCYTRKGGSKRFSERLLRMDYKAVRHVVLTVDPKKFDGSGQKAYETMRGKKAIAQFVHDLKRTGKIKVKDWAWNLEWHTDGCPHWHLFIETKRGMKGQIGNKKLLQHWDYGLIREKYIKSRKHWFRFTNYFAGHGYFDPHQNVEDKKKEHQLELPKWAKDINYRIRKTGSMVKKNRESAKGDGKDSLSKKYIEEKNNEGDTRTYREILDSCGLATYCQIQKLDGGMAWKKINIPYSCFRQFPGEYKAGHGYVVQMSLDDFFIFRGLYDNNITAGPGELEAA